MAFERVSSLLKKADKANTSVLAFNCIDFNTVYPVITVAEELKKPVIVMFYPEHFYKNNVFNLAGFAAMVKTLAEEVKVPIGLHLDHSSDYEFIMKAIKGGFTSVMYDGSSLPLEENIANTRKVVETAHVLGVDVEAELGHVGIAVKNDQYKEDLYTKADVASHFCKETNVDSVAIAIGSAHGVYLTTPQLDLKRLDEINAATATPLVLHGGSGIPSDQLDEAFKRGINKFNIGTEYFQLYFDSCKEYTENNKSIFDFPVFAQEKLKNYLRNKMLLSKF
ncbi:fructose-bisphosphate aldolase [Spirochaetia bacterium]|nr:fructose-bisphosphate aldolase [Spirochaetia bacterium]